MVACCRGLMTWHRGAERAVKTPEGEVYSSIENQA